jgi:uncharacterized protein YgbK (DUF1537 family)
MKLLPFFFSSPIQDHLTRNKLPNFIKISERHSRSSKTTSLSSRVPTRTSEATSHSRLTPFVKPSRFPEAPILFIPFFADGGCLTLNDTHYIVEGDNATPAHLTPFAKDKAFPFSHSYLPDYLAEKSQGPLDIQSLSLADLRSGDITTKLAELPDGSTCIVNATSLKDLNVLSLALLKSDRRFIIRSASSFVQSLAGIPSRPPLEPWQLQDLEPNPNGGLIIISSETPETHRPT